MNFSRSFLEEVQVIANAIDDGAIEAAVQLLSNVNRIGGRLFILGVGGSAANASHAVNDFRKICGIEAYAPTDNVAEITARTNDDGWETVFDRWLMISRLNSRDLLLIFSVGGGSDTVSQSLVNAIAYAKTQGSSIIGIVGRDGGYTARVADVCIRIPTINLHHITPHAESWQAIIWHLLVSHPELKKPCL